MFVYKINIFNVKIAFCSSYLNNFYFKLISCSLLKPKSKFRQSFNVSFFSNRLNLFNRFFYTWFSSIKLFYSDNKNKIKFKQEYSLLIIINKFKRFLDFILFNFKFPLKKKDKLFFFLKLDIISLLNNFKFKNNFKYLKLFLNWYQNSSCFWILNLISINSQDDYLKEKYIIINKKQFFSNYVNYEHLIYKLRMNEFNKSLFVLGNFRQLLNIFNIICNVLWYQFFM